MPKIQDKTIIKTILMYIFGFYVISLIKNKLLEVYWYKPTEACAKC